MVWSGLEQSRQLPNFRDPIFQNAFLGIGTTSSLPSKPTIKNFNAAPLTYDELLYIDWKYITNQSITVSVLFGGTTTIIFHLENDHYVGRIIHRFELKGLGIGISNGFLVGLDATFTEYKKAWGCVVFGVHSARSLFRQKI
jgi:hypothetical protein